MVLGSLVITLREGLEAALILSIVLAYLRQVGASHRRTQVWWGVAAAAGLSVVAALLIQTMGAQLEGAAEALFEGTVMLLAAGVLTWMIFWMARQARLIKGELQQSVDRALAGSARLGLFTLAFVAVLREGIETALFLSAAAFSSSPLETLVGGLLGLAVAIALGVLLYLGSLRLDLRTFFSVTGLLLLLFAAGLLAHGVHEFQEVGLLPVYVEHLWSTKALLDDRSAVGGLLRSLFGYNDDPSLLEAVAYLGYLAVVGRAVLSSLLAPRPRVSARPA
jgi:high-affinity iron transporter